jgi:hypothetical protein
MTASQPNLLELAKQGDARAIAALMNRQLQPKGITAKVSLKDGCLQVMLEAPQIPPDQQALSSFIHKGILGLGSSSIQQIKVYGRQTGEEFPGWMEECEVAKVPNVSLMPQPMSVKSSSFKASASPKVLKPNPLITFQNLALWKRIVLIAGLALAVVLYEYIFALAFVGLLCFLLFSILNQTNKLAQRYENAKEALRKDPKNVSLRESTLQAGRKYYARLRGGKLSIYDEQALTNDLSIILSSDPKN